MRLADPGSIDFAPDGAAPGAPVEWRQFVTFTVADRSYDVDIAAVREIIRWTRLTPLPHQPAHSRGVLNLRGTIVPVQDLRARLEGGPTEATDTHVIVITWIGAQTVGIMVDAVSDILNVPAETVRTPPAGAAGAEAGIVAGLVSPAPDRIVTILELGALFGPSVGRRN